MHYQTIDEANQAVAAKIVAGSPFLVDVVPAKSCQILDGFHFET